MTSCFLFFFTISEYIITFCSETTLTNLGIYFVRMLLIKEMLAICLVDSWSHHLSWGITFSFAKKNQQRELQHFGWEQRSLWAVLSHHGPLKNYVCASRAHYRHVGPIQLYIVHRLPGSAYLFCFDWFLIFVSSCERNQAEK